MFLIDCSHECYIGDRFWGGELLKKSTRINVVIADPNIRMIS